MHRDEARNPPQDRLNPSFALRATEGRQIRIAEILMTKTKLLKWLMPYGDVGSPRNGAELRIWLNFGVFLGGSKFVSAYVERDKKVLEKWIFVLPPSAFGRFFYKKLQEISIFSRFWVSASASGWNSDISYLYFSKSICPFGKINRRPLSTVCR